MTDDDKLKNAQTVNRAICETAQKLVDEPGREPSVIRMMHGMVQREMLALYGPAVASAMLQRDAAVLNAVDASDPKVAELAAATPAGQA
ncbi:MAG: hypothetical protein AAFS07_11950 [Pseudomonadota bacterium]